MTFSSTFIQVLHFNSLKFVKHCYYNYLKKVIYFLNIDVLGKISGMMIRNIKPIIRTLLLCVEMNNRKKPVL